MKKKIGDLTLRESNRMCIELDFCCTICPLYEEVHYWCKKDSDEYYDEEVEVPDEEA